MASIVQRGDRWQVKVRRRGHPPVSRTFARRADAERFARQVEAEIDRGAFVSLDEAHRATMSDLFERYRREVLPRLRGKHAAPALRVLEERLGRWSPAALTARRIAEYRDSRLEDGVSGETVRKELGTLSRVLDVAMKEWGVALPANPVRLVTRPAPSRHRERRLVGDEEARLIASLARCRNPYMLPLAQLALETAMRQGELLKLMWSDVDLRRRIALLRDTKNGEDRAVPLSSRAVTILSALPRAIDGRVFPVSQSLVVQAWGHAVKRAGIRDLRFHDLRHEALSRLAERGDLSVLELAAVSGHKTLQMLKRYTHLQAARLAEKLG
ncbi:MAG: site-specific integrase [Burkholderiaceae bacterium]|nr:site-specific integrase [Burkholderiaceae bacterium]